MEIDNVKDCIEVKIHAGLVIAEMEADARRAIPADKIKTGSKED